MFYCSYYGNKRQELKYLDFSDLDSYDCIVEPFCGSAAFSFYCFNKLGYRKPIIISDTDKQLIGFLLDIQQNGSKKYFEYCNEMLKDLTHEKHKNLCSMEKLDLFNWFYNKKIRGNHQGAYPIRNIGKEITYGKRYTEYDEFLKHCIILNQPFEEVYELYKNEKCLMFLDPPYLDSYNLEYDLKDADGTRYYASIIQKLKNKEKCNLLMIINGNALTKYVYRKFIKKEYEKVYSTTKKKNVHIVISNY